MQRSCVLRDPDCIVALPTSFKDKSHVTAQPPSSRTRACILLTSLPQQAVKFWSEREREREGALDCSSQLAAPKLLFCQQAWQVSSSCLATGFCRVWTGKTEWWRSHPQCHHRCLRAGSTTLPPTDAQAKKVLDQMHVSPSHADNDVTGEPLLCELTKLRIFAIALQRQSTWHSNRSGAQILLQ